MPTALEKTLSYLGFIQVFPSVALSSFVDCYWFLKTPAYNSPNSIEYLHPSGDTGIILNYGDAMSFGNHSASEPIIIDGTNTFARKLHLRGNLEIVGIRFKPAGAARFLSIPLNEIKDTVVTPDKIALNAAPTLYDEVYKAKTIPLKASVIDSWLIKNAATRDTPDIIYPLLSHLNQQNGNMKMRELSKNMGVGQRKIQRLFNSYVGLSPKEYLSNRRIIEARKRIKNVRIEDSFSLTNIAYDLGFHDQSHFIHEFKRIEGITPGEQLKNISDKFG